MKLTLFQLDRRRMVPALERRGRVIRQIAAKLGDGSDSPGFADQREVSDHASLHFMMGSSPGSRSSNSAMVRSLTIFIIEPMSAVRDLDLGYVEAVLFV